MHLQSDGFVNGSWMLLFCRFVGKSEAGRVASAEAGDGGFDGSVADAGTQSSCSHQLQVRTAHIRRLITGISQKLLCHRYWIWNIPLTIDFTASYSSFVSLKHNGFWQAKHTVSIKDWWHWQMRNNSTWFASIFLSHDLFDLFNRKVRFSRTSELLFNEICVETRTCQDPKRTKNHHKCSPYE